MSDKYNTVQDNTEAVNVVFDLQLFNDDPPASDPVIDPTPAVSVDSVVDPVTDPPVSDPIDPVVAVAPEQYTEFTVPENFSAPIDDFKTWAKENNMTQEAAQSVVDFYTSKVAPQMQAQHEAQVEAWAKESTEKYGKEGIEAANNALSRFSTPEFKQFLQETGLGNRHEMIAIFKDIHSKISESSFVTSPTSPNNSTKLYPNSPDLYK
jgi:hypothetical protein